MKTIKEIFENQINEKMILEKNFIDKEVLNEEAAEQVAYSIVEMTENLLNVYGELYGRLRNASSTKEDIENALNELTLNYQRVDYLLHSAKHFNFGKMEWTGAVDELYDKK